MSNAGPNDERRAAIAALWRAGREAWPELALAEDAFAAWLTPRIEPGQDPRRLVAADLYLVAACLHEVPGAVKALVEGPVARSIRHVPRVQRLARGEDELCQVLAVKLLLPSSDSGPPRISQYGGRGSLAVWLRMVAVRQSLSERRKPDRTVPLDEVAYEQVAGHNPEISAMRRFDQPTLRALVREAVAATPRPDRLVLRLRFIEGATLEVLANVLGTSRSSMHRRVEEVRQALLRRVAGLVKARLRLTESELDSVMRFFESDMRDTLADALVHEADPAPARD